MVREQQSLKLNVIDLTLNITLHCKMTESLVELQNKHMSGRFYKELNRQNGKTGKLR